MKITSFIRKLPDGKYRVFSEKGKNMGTYDSLKGAKKRLKDIEFFKHRKNNLVIDERYVELVAELISLHGLYPKESELHEFLNIKGLDDAEVIFNTALLKLRHESKSDNL